MHVNTQQLAMETQFSLTVCLHSAELRLFSFSGLLGDPVSMVIVALISRVLLLLRWSRCSYADILK